ncbi:MAG TPA: hypothetical protein VN317_08240 [Candidatus Methanoperedens sp.]|nr:hypothetical protein [Candidatus Methanoperedens sp.]
MSGVDSRGDSERRSRLSPVWFWLAWSALAGTLFLRETGHFLNPQFWAEDALVFFKQSLEDGFLRSLVTPSSGYLHTFPRLVAGLALLFPPKSTPLIFNLAACAAQMLPIFYLLSGRLRRYLPSPVMRVVAAAVYVAAPNSYETYVNLTNSQWNLTLAALLALLADRPASRWIRGAELCMLAVFAVTGPFGIVLLPCAALNLFERRRDAARGWWIAMTGVLAAGAAAQLPLMLTAERVTAGVGPSVTLPQGLQIITTHAFYNALLGIGRMTEARWANDLATNRGAQLLGLAVVGVLIAFVVLQRHRALGCLLYLSCVTITLSFLSPLNELDQWLAPNFAPRYYLYATLFVLYATILLCLRGGRLRWLGAALALLSLTVGIPGDFRYESQRLDTRWGDQVSVFESLPQGASLHIPVQPSPYVWFTLRKKTPGRNVPPLAGLHRLPGEPSYALSRPTFRDRSGLQYVEFSGRVSGTREGEKKASVWLVIDGRVYPPLVREIMLGASSDDRSSSRHYTQFRHEVPLSDLRPGRNSVSLVLLARDGTGYVAGAEKEFSIVVDGLKLITTDVR